MIARLAQGLTVHGSERKRKCQVSPEIQRLVEQYKRRVARANNEIVQLSPLEQAWRTERASMGHIEIPDVKIALRESSN